MHAAAYFHSRIILMEKQSLLVVAFLLLVFQTYQIAADEICGLNGYDLGALQAPAYWTIRIPKNKDCILPLGLEEEDIVGCNVYISVCKSLDTVCPGAPSSSTCQEVFTTINGTYYYDIGKFTTSDEFNPLNENVTGFTTTRMSAEAIASGDCNDTVNTFLFFICQESANWNPSNENVTKYISRAQQLSPLQCSYAIELFYSGACYNAPTLSPSQCSINEYDVAPLSNREYWTAQVDPSVCFDSPTVCQLQLAFCHPLPPQLGDSCYDSTICQIGLNTTNVKNSEYSMGAFSDITRFYENDNKQGFHLKVDNGSKTSNCNNGLDTQIIVYCDKSAEWKSQDISSFLKVHHASGSEPCSYVVEIAYNGSCVGANLANPVSPVGWIFIGIFAFVVVAYLGIGSAYMFFVKKERGVRILPNYDFWAAFLMSVLSGCVFFLNAITCFQFQGKIASRQPDYDKI